MAGTHVIRRELLDVQVFGAEAEGFSVHHRLPDLARDWLNPAIEKVLDRVVPADEQWIVDTLLLDAGTLPAGNFEGELVQAVSEALEKALRERAPRSAPVHAETDVANPDVLAQALEPGSSHIVRRAGTGSLRLAFAHFLRTGVLPWWFTLLPGETLDQCLREAWQGEGRDELPAAFARAMRESIEHAWPRNRLVRQFSSDILGALLRALSREAFTALQSVLAKIQQSGVGEIPEFTEHLWERAFAHAVRNEPIAPELLLAEACEEYSSQATPGPAMVARLETLLPVQAKDISGKAGRSARRRGEQPPNSEIDLDQGVFIGCAGVVLLHPFLPRFFEALDIAKDEVLLQPKRALALLHFLATGQREAPEHELLLAKILCDVPAGTPARSRIELTAAEEEEAGSLLRALIGHWDALGDVTADALRGSFLVRPGKLSRRGDSDVLQVEARGFDILLDRLPWGIGIVQLPWMKKKLWVEWRL